MQRELVVKGCGLSGASDLTLLAPLRKGFVESLDSMTYKTRTKRVLAGLHGARKTAHEYATARLLSDAVERVGVIHSVRVAVLEPEDKVLLAVTFDGPWEAYVRVLWDKVGTLLDLIFCNTEGYVTAWGHSYEEWAQWARGVQVETGFFYGPASSTAQDVLYDRRVQIMRERSDDPAQLSLKELRAVLPTAEQATERLAHQIARVDDDPPIRNVEMFAMARQSIRQGVQALAQLYRLTDLFVPMSDDGPVLRRAAIDLLREFVELVDTHLFSDELAEQELRFERQLKWLFPDARAVLVPRPRPPMPPAYAVPVDVRADVQGGVLRPYDKVTHGAVLLFAFDGPGAAAALLGDVTNQVTRDIQPHDAVAGTVYRNLAFTAAGLHALGMDEDTLALFPDEFRQGMAMRAGSLGDVRNNHPRRWRLPQVFRGVNQPPGPDVIDMTSVHAVLQLRSEAVGPAATDAQELTDPAHPLRAEIERWAEEAPGARLLSVQTMRRRYAQRNGQPAIVEHFGYADGEGQPDIEYDASTPASNRVPLGEVLWGHPNGSDFAVDAADPRYPWLFNGSFLVLRKYRQFVERLQAAVNNTALQMQKQLGGDVATHAESVYAALMGRRRDGTPLIPTQPGRLNDFTYDKDPQGRQCPLHAHIRRVHPRLPLTESGRQPRLVRRGMSYGPTPDGSEADRGLVFMAYNQSLGEQFEVVQRWLAGGNSTGSSSNTSCPIVGVPENGFPRVFLFEHVDSTGRPHVFKVELEERTALFDSPQVATQLEWGLYLFAPSISSLKRLRDTAAKAAAIAPATIVAWQVSKGLAQLEALERIEAEQGAEAAMAAWKAALEDPAAIDRLEAAALWAAIREHRGGLLKTSYGTLIASRELAAQVFLDAKQRYSVSGQRSRMMKGFGDIYLGLDAGADYDDQATVMNDAIGALKFEAVFAHARDSATQKIDRIVAQAHEDACDFGEKHYDVTFEAREVMEHVIADLCEEWFGVQDGPPGLLARGGTDWAWTEGHPMLYPGHFTALSRNMFQPHPGPVPEGLGTRYGLALRKAMVSFVAPHVENRTVPRAPGSGQPAPLAQAAFDYLAKGRDADFVARMMVGVLMGFIPTIIGAVLNVLVEWRREGCFDRLHTALRGRGVVDVEAARTVFGAAMRAAASMRPMPQITWRTVREDHTLTGAAGHRVELRKDDVVILALVSGTQQSVADGRPDGHLMFGGDRSAAPHPTHACPGYQAGIASMMGSLAALLSRAESIREGPAPLSYVIEGPTRCAGAPAAKAPAMTPAIAEAPAKAVPVPSPAPVPTPAPVPVPVLARAPATLMHKEALKMGDGSLQLFTGTPQPGSRKRQTIMAWGDSWFSYELGFAFGMDIRDWLENFGYRIPKTFCDWFKWGTIQTMAENTRPFTNELGGVLQGPDRPNAILLSGGGNDSTGVALGQLLNRKGTAPDVLNPDAVKAHISAMRKHYVTVLTEIAQTLESARGGPPVPVMIHGYDHPIPAGQGLPFKRKWLHNPFMNAGYTTGDDQIDLPVAKQAMVDLIDALNSMLQTLSTEFGFVRYVDLRGTIAGFFPGDEVRGWHDDLHPQDPMFKMMAAKIDAAVLA